MADSSLAHVEVAHYFDDRAAGLAAVQTTETPSGQSLYWIEPRSQVRSGRLASPPPIPAMAREIPPGALELDDPTVAHGPPGTVPVLRREVSNVAPEKSAAEYLAKPGPDRYRPDPDPNLITGFFHAALDSETIRYGAEATLNVWDPQVEDTEDHSLMQVWLVNSDGPLGQSVEAGWMVSTYQYEDSAPHLFTWYTTNGWGASGPDIGGYDANQSGWVQTDDTIFPGAAIQQVSVADGNQATLSIKFTVWQGNWWFMALGRWVGYYPGSLFSKSRPGQTLCDRATRVLFGGEVYSSNSNPMATTTQMGSGAFPDRCIGYSCFQGNLRVQTDLAGTMTDLVDATPMAEAPAMYAVDPHCASGTPMGSYFLAGGPGARPNLAN